MLTLLSLILMVIVFGKVLGLALRATWGISKIIVSVILLPLMLLVLIIKGVLTIAVPVLLIVGIFAFLKREG